MVELVSRGSSKVNVSKSYGGSFGNLPDGTIYADRMGVTGQPQDITGAIAKAFESDYRLVDEYMADGGSFRGACEMLAVQKGISTDDVQLPVFPRSDFVNLAARRTPFRAAAPRISAETDTVTQDSVTDLADPVIGGETDVPEDGDDDIEPQQLSMTYYRVRGSASGPVQLASQTLRNEMGQEQARKEMAMQQFEENLMLNGDPTGGTTDGSLADERGYKGVLTLAEESGEVTDAEVDDEANENLDLETARYAMTQATNDGGDYASILNVTTNSLLTSLKNSLDETNQVVISGPDGDIEVGARGVLVDGTPTVVSDFMPEGTFATVDMRYHRVHNLADLTMEPLAKTNDSDEFFLKRYQVFEQAAGAGQYTHVIENLS